MEAKKLAKPAPHPFHLSIRIRHPSIDPAELSRELGIEPEHSFRAGDPRPSRSAMTPASVRTESYWLGALDSGELDVAFLRHLKLEAAPQFATAAAAATQSLGWALSLKASRFFNVHSDFLRRIRTDGGEISLLVALSPDRVMSFTLAPEVSRVFGELGVTVEFELTNE